MRNRRERPLVYSCSGCSSAAQMTNWLAIQLDRRGVAEMSCIAGVGGDVRSLVRKATSGRTIIAIDGCALECARHCLARHGVTPDLHHRLSDAGVRKRLGEDFDPDQAEEVLGTLLQRVATEIQATGVQAAQAPPPAGT
ncbi:putative zinc-binding protein [Actinomadura formosensis]|uniref:putative zinc-binding protein n=1 Tax=Actinomadura formosensis TaxID=60706 RepID=UPI00082E5530|nr:putative zinc-binding protein [Actinomadura formosensis]